MTRGIGFALCTAVCFLCVLGCGQQQRVAPSIDAAGKEKVKALEWVADELAKDPEGPGAQAALEQFRIMELDAQKSPEQATKLVEVYRQRIEGKYQGAVAQEVHGAMTPYLKK